MSRGVQVWPMARGKNCPAVTLECRAAAKRPKGQHAQDRNRTLFPIGNFNRTKSAYSGEQKEATRKLVGSE